MHEPDTLRNADGLRPDLPVGRHNLQPKAGRYPEPPGNGAGLFAHRQGLGDRPTGLVQETADIRAALRPLE